MNQNVKLPESSSGVYDENNEWRDMYTAREVEAIVLSQVKYCTDKLREEIEALKHDLDQYRDAALKEHEHAERLEDLCAAAYQMAGVHDAPVEWLDALSNAANGRPFSTDGLLPYMPEAVCDAEARAKKLEEALRAIRKHTGEHNTHMAASAALREQENRND